MDDFLDRELGKPIEDINADKVESYIEKYLKDQNIKEPTSKENHKSYNKLKKIYLRRQKNENRVSLKRVLIPLSTIIIGIILGTTVYAYACGINIFEEFISLFKKDDYTVVDKEEIYHIDIEPNEQELNKVGSLDELLVIEPQMQYLNYFDQYIVSINYNETELSKLYTISIKYNEKDIMIRAYLYNDDELTNTMFNEIVADTTKTRDISNITYYYNDNIINFIADDNMIYTIYNLKIEDLEEIIR